VTIKTKVKKNYVKKIYDRNKMYLHALHLPGMLLPVWHIQLFFECLLNLLVFHFYYLAAVFQYLRNWPAVHVKRKAFRELARQESKTLLSLRAVTKEVLNTIRKEEVIILK
jgi:hypothetical protein